MEEDKDKSPEDSIPLADDDPQGIRIPIGQPIIRLIIYFLIIITAIIHDDQDISQCSDVIVRNQSMDSLQSSFTNGSISPSRNSEYFFVGKNYIEYSPYKIKLYTVTVLYRYNILLPI